MNLCPACALCMFCIGELLVCLASVASPPCLSGQCGQSCLKTLLLHLSLLGGDVSAA
jgi:hypothetical protein